MQVALDRSDRKLLIGALLLMIVMVVATALLAPPAPSPSPSASSYSTDSNGAKAAYLLLGELGYHEERWSQPLSELPISGEGMVLVLADRSRGIGIGDVDSERLEQFIRGGGWLVYTGSGINEVLNKGSSELMELFDATTRTYPAVSVSPLTRGATVITMGAPVRWNSPELQYAPLYAQGGNAVVVTYPLDKGRVIWWASSMPLTNAGIELPGNLRLLLNSLGNPESSHVLWDEYYHGERRTLSSYLAGTPIVWMLLQAGLIYFVLILAYGRRSGPVRPAVVESRQSPLEFVETLGALYQSAGSASGAVETVWQRFRFLVGTRLGLPASASVKQIFESARERLGWREPGLYETLQRAERSAHDLHLKNDEALQIVSSLEQYVGLLELNRMQNEEKRTWQSK
jgi:hypothetical protein